jgi:hypothetical protein
MHSHIPHDMLIGQRHTVFTQHASLTSPVKEYQTLAVRGYGDSRRTVEKSIRPNTIGASCQMENLSMPCWRGRNDHCKEADAAGLVATFFPGPSCYRGHFLLVSINSSDQVVDGIGDIWQRAHQ